MRRNFILIIIKMNVNKSKSQNNNNFLTNFGSLQSIFLIFWRLNYFKYIFTSSYHCMIEQQNTYTCTHSVSDKKPLINPPVFSTGDMWLAFHADVSASLSSFTSSSSFFTSADLETITPNANQSNGCNQSDFDYLKQSRKKKLRSVPFSL